MFNTRGRRSRQNIVLYDRRPVPFIINIGIAVAYYIILIYLQIPMYTDRYRIKGIIVGAQNSPRIDNFSF